MRLMSRVCIFLIWRRVSLPSPELIVKLAKALDADVDEMSYREQTILLRRLWMLSKKQPKAVPNFSALSQDLTPEQWQVLQQQLDSMVGDKGSDES